MTAALPPRSPSSRPPAIAALAGVVVLADLATKAYAERNLTTPVDLLLGAQFALGHNPGVAFGRFAEAPTALVALGGALCLAGLVLALVRGWLPLQPISAGLLLGGAAANLLDRSADGRVTDFISLPHWPTFNVADVAISLSVIALVMTAFAPTPALTATSSEPRTLRK